MSDQRTRLPIKIVDPTTDANAAGVDSDDNLKVILGVNDGVDVGDVDVATMPATAAEAAALPGVVMVVAGDDGTDTHILQLDTSGSLKAVLQAADGIDIGDVDIATQANEETDDDDVADGQTAQRVISLGFGHDGSSWERLATDGSGALNAILSANDGIDIGDVDVATMPGTAAESAALPSEFVVVAGDDGVDTHPLQVDANGYLKAVLEGGPTGASALEVQGTAADGAAAAGDPVQVGGVDGSANAQSLKTDTDGHLQVDVLTGGGTDSPTNPTIDTANSTDTAAGSPADLDSAEIAEAEKLWEVHISASVPFKAQIKIVEDGTPRNISALMFAQAGQTIIWRTPHRNFAEHAGAQAGLDVFRATVTNMDNSEAADLHAAFYYST